MHFKIYPWFSKITTFISFGLKKTDDLLWIQFNLYLQIGWVVLQLSYWVLHEWLDTVWENSGMNNRNNAPCPQTITAANMYNVQLQAYESCHTCELAWTGYPNAPFRSRSHSNKEAQNLRHFLSCLFHIKTLILQFLQWFS